MWVVRNIISGKELPLLSKHHNSKVGAEIQLRRFAIYYNRSDWEYQIKRWEIIEIKDNYKNYISEHYDWERGS